MQRAWAIAVVLGCGGGSENPPVDPPDGTSEPAAISLAMEGGANATFVAVRDGDGPWLEVAGDAGVYTARVTSNRYGWWIGCVRAGFSSNAILYKHLDDGVDTQRGSCTSRVLPLEISGTITGVGEAESAEVYSLWSFDSPSATYSVGAEAAPAQLLASRLDTNFRAASVIRVDLGAIAANVTRNLDFAQEGQPVVRVPVAITGGEPDFAFDTLTGIYAGDGSMYLPFETTAGPQVSLLALPPAMQLPGDMLEASVFARRELAGGLGDQRGAGTTAATLPATLALPPAKSFGDATVVEVPFSIEWTLPPLEPGAVVSAFWFASSGGSPLLTSIDASARWAAGSTTLDLLAPESLDQGLVQSPGSFRWTIDEITGDVRGTWSSTGTSGQTPIGVAPAHAKIRRTIRRMRLR